MQKEQDFQWSLTEHACRVCFGRVLMRKTFDRRKVYRCACCGVEREGDGPAAICTCGIKLKSGVNAGIRCIVNPSPSPECPHEVIAEQASIEAVPATKPADRKPSPESDGDLFDPD